jgi:hypothetical protein
MTEVAGRRMTAEIEGDFVVFLIGARFNSKLQFTRGLLDLGGRRGMKHMLDHLVARPEKGLLAYEMGLPTIVQYWRSFDHLEAFARDKDDPHLDVWRRYWRRVGRSSRTGIWHETYLVQAGQYEAIYGNMPPHGLGKAGRLVPLSEASSARARTQAATSASDTGRPSRSERQAARPMTSGARASAGPTTGGSPADSADTNAPHSPR